MTWKKLNPETGEVTYLAAGSHKLHGDHRISIEEANNQGSTLVMTLINENDVGDYVCEISSRPPATLRHVLSISTPPTVQILRPTDGIYKVVAGEELALVCHGTGDPAPTIEWKREKRRLPDGRVSLKGNQIIYKNVTRKYSGTYICEGSNGPGQTAIDSIVVDVLRKSPLLGDQ